MHPADVAPMAPLPPGTVVAFLLLVLAVTVRAAALIGAPISGEAPEVSRRWRRLAAFGASAWLLLSALPAATGVLAGPGPRLFGFLFTTLGLTAAISLTQAGARAATRPLWLLIGFQAFRLPLEIVLHLWHRAGAVPVQMTWEGENLDVLTGAVSLPILLARRDPPRPLGWAVWGIGAALLLNVVRVALTSAPTPLRRYPDPPLLLPLYFPSTWIVTVCVAGALFVHLAALRHLLAPPSVSTGPNSR